MRFPQALSFGMGILLGARGSGAGPAARNVFVPPLTGELSGNFQPLQLAGAPELHWKIAFELPAAEQRRAVFTAEGPGTRLRVELQLDAAGTGAWRLLEGRLELGPWLGGRISSGRAELSGEGRIEGLALTGELVLKLHDVDLGELLALADPEKAYVRTASGRVQGTVGVRLRANAFGAGDSRLSLVPGTVATLTFVPSPGLLTGYIPAQVLKAYPGIEAIEMGRTPLEAKVLALVFRPDGDSEGRGARVRIEGRPLDPKIIAPLELDVNFTGPLESVVRKALDSRLKVKK
ncbi:MAG: hypothetical protein JWM88_2959 [Verrucomicrobia bacterium]|nr:hypothetical protein [Verrucomicrobiota bacterium]